MVNVEPAPSRLDFVAAARSAFDFVGEPPYLLRLTDQGESRVGYEGPDLALVVFHDRLSYELGIHLWRPSVDEELDRPYTMSDLIRVRDPAAARAYRRFAATTADSVRRGATKLAVEFRTYGTEALVRSPAFFVKLADARAEAVRQHSEAIDLRAARDRAGKAWANQDFAAIVAAYAPLGDRLTEAERGRLRYARNQLAK